MAQGVFQFSGRYYCEGFDYWRFHDLQANTLQAYDVFDLNGVRLGRLRAYTMDEAASVLQNTSDIKVQGIYMLRSVNNGTVKQVRIAR